MYRTYSVSRRDREPLVDFMVSALESSGCEILHRPDATEAPFRITCETPTGERIGIVAYAFLANQRVTKNRPADEHRFQIKYGSKSTLGGKLQPIWQDPYGLDTTLLVGINPDRGFFVGADPILHHPTRFFISIELKERDVEAVLEKGWHSWERSKRTPAYDQPGTEVLVGGTAEAFLKYVRFERAAKGLDPGHRQLLAEKGEELLLRPVSTAAARRIIGAAPLHEMAAEFQLSEDEILDLIASAPRLKMAVRGWVAEKHLESQLRGVRGVECARIEEEGQPDLWVRYQGGPRLLIECKNVLRRPLSDGAYRLDFQKTRHSKNDPCTRYYSASDFDLLAACLHSCTEEWSFRYALTGQLDAHAKCDGKLSHLVRIAEHDARWTGEAASALELASEARS